MGNWVNKDVENPTKSLYPIIRTEADMTTKIIPRKCEEIPRQKTKESGKINKYIKKIKV